MPHNEAAQRQIEAAYVEELRKLGPEDPSPAKEVPLLAGTW